MGAWMARICPGKASADSQGLGVYSGPTFPSPWGRIRGWKTSWPSPVLPPRPVFSVLLFQCLPNIFHIYFIPRAFWGQPSSWPTATKQFLNILSLCPTPVPLHRKPWRGQEMKEPNEDFLPAVSLYLAWGQEADDTPCGPWDPGLELAGPSIMGHPKNRSICGRA